MAYVPRLDDGKRLFEYMAASGVPIPPHCRTVTIHWRADNVACVTFEVMPESVPDMPIPIEGAEVKTVVVDRTVLGDDTRKAERCTITPTT